MLHQPSSRLIVDAPQALDHSRSAGEQESSTQANQLVAADHRTASRFARAERYQRAVEAREKVVVGANEFVIEEDSPHILYIDETVARQQSAKLKILRAQRSNDEVRRKLDALKKAASQEPNAGTNGNVSSANTMPYIVDAVRAYATVGEICEALRQVYGTYTEVSIT